MTIINMRDFYYWYTQDEYMESMLSQLQNHWTAVGMSTNTVQKYVAALGEKGFISIENTSVITKSGQKRNGTLRYTIHPIQNAVDLYHQRQLRKLEIDLSKSRLATQTAV